MKIRLKKIKLSGLDDNFIGRYLLIGNIGFIVICHISRLYLGSLHESIEYQILSGNLETVVEIDSVSGENSLIFMHQWKFLKQSWDRVVEKGIKF